MRSEELLIMLLVGGVLLVMPLAALILSITALVKMRRIEELSKRIIGIENYLRRLANAPPETAVHRPVEVNSTLQETVSSPPAQAIPVVVTARSAETVSQPVDTVQIPSMAPAAPSRRPRRRS